MTKLLTIWIPTYRRPRQLSSLLVNIDKSGLALVADVVVSDNDPEGSLALALAHCEQPISYEVIYRRNVANLSAGANFLRAFELSSTPWLMIVGDDDLFDVSAAEMLKALRASLSESVFAVKFDSSLFGVQPLCRVSSLQLYVDQLCPRRYAEAFNNLCLVSNWLFRCEPYRKHLASAYLGYSSKISHLFPALRACARDGGELLFSPMQPVIHGTTEASSWPKAATWYEMVITLSSFSGFVDRADRLALLRLLFHADWRRNLAKCLRVHQFFGDGSQGVKSWQVHGHLALISGGYRLALMIAFPLLLLPAGRLPRRLRQQLGDPGSVERW